MVRWIRTFACVIAVAGVLAPTLATCTAGALEPESQQMACCTAGHEACGPEGTPADCCKRSPSGDRQFTTAARVTAAQPVFVRMMQAPGSTLTRPEPAWHAGALPASSSPPGSKHPTYLRLSALRI